MTEKEYTEEEVKELDRYLSRDFYYDVYQELLGDGFEGYKDLFEPLELFRLIHSQIEFISQNSSQPYAISQNLKKYNLKEDQLYFLCKKLLHYIEFEWRYNHFPKAVPSELLRIKADLNVFQDRNDSIEKDNRKFNFENVKKYLGKLSDREKIVYLIEKKTEYLQHNKSEEVSGISFDKKCDLEIEKIEKIQKTNAYYDILEAESWGSIKEDEPSEDNKVGNNQERNKGLTLDQTVLFFSHLFTHLNVNSHNKQKAKVIADLTRFSENTIQQQFSVVYKKALDSPKTYNKDMRIVQRLFEAVDLYEISSKIEKDLRFK